MGETLTPQQKQAVTDRGGKLLVSAAAGSGKTKVLVDRLMLYLQDPAAPANLDDFLIITYTKAAAAELRGKIASKLSEHIAQNPKDRHLQQQMQRLYLTPISTVHAFCGDILRQYAYKLDIPSDFRVADENECAELRLAVAEKVLEQAYDSAAEDPDFCALVDTQGIGRNDRQIPEILLKVYDSARCHLDPKKWLRDCMDLVEIRGISDAAETEFGRYLLRSLKQWLQLQIDALDRCAQLASQTDGLEKPAALFAAIVSQLRSLQACQTWDQVVTHPPVDFGTLRPPKNCADPDLFDQIKAVREACKKGFAKQMKPFADLSGRVLADLGDSAQSIRGIVSLVERFSKEYDAAKRSRRILDFGDLEHRMLDLLLGKQRSGPTAAANEIAHRFREILVDEYQDSNEVQDAIYGALSHAKQNLFLVGDVKQSIYQFRLADPGIFLEKYKTFVPAAEAAPGQGRKVLLSQNFRSGGAILAAANDVFRSCMTPEVGGLRYGPEEALYEGTPHIPLEDTPVELYCVDVQEETYPEEAAFVAQRIRSMLKDGTCVRQDGQLRPVRPEDIVILLRSPGSSGWYYQQALESAGIPCTTGGGVDLLQTEEIAALRCVLQAVYNPRLDIPLIGALASPVFGFTADDLARIRADHKKGCFYEALQQSGYEKAVAFMGTLRQLRGALRRQNVTGLLEEIWLQTHMDDVFDAMDSQDLRRKNLQTFFQIAADFERNAGDDLGRFLEYLDRMEEKGLVTTGDAIGSGAVTIMSIHKSKGLEFPVVFLCGLGREFNMESQRAQVLCHKDMGLGLSAVDVAQRIRYPSIAKRAIATQMGMESVSEEMRVLYVAMTRPKDRLIMTYASKRLEKDLKEMVSRMDIGSRDILIREAVCPGEWVLLTALQRSEAGELFALGGYPGQVSPGEPAWKIRVVQAAQEQASESQNHGQQCLSEELLAQLKAGLSYRYPHPAATAAPSKQTATQLKGRIKDQEAAENTPAQKKHRIWRQPDFAPRAMSGKDLGNTVHAILQHIDYGACGDAFGVQQEIDRMVAAHFLTQQQAALADSKKIAAFFDTEIGWKLRSGANCVREFKFSVMQQGIDYDPALAGEEILLQGVVDCAIIEDDGIIVIDFKTDHVTEQTLPAVVDRYRTQVEVYRRAMQRIYQRPVKAAMLYFFQLDRFVEV